MISIVKQVRGRAVAVEGGDQGRRGRGSEACHVGGCLEERDEVRVEESGVGSCAAGGGNNTPPATRAPKRQARTLAGPSMGVWRGGCRTLGRCAGAALEGRLCEQEGFCLHNQSRRGQRRARRNVCSTCPRGAVVMHNCSAAPLASRGAVSRQPGLDPREKGRGNQFCGLP
jgi:hypothetical protein